MKIFSDKKTAAVEFKKSLAVLTAICCIMALTFTVFAEQTQKIELKASGSEAEVILTFPQAAAEGIASLQIALSVTANSDDAAIEFIPDSGLAAKIVESRYHSDTGVFNIYLAGTKALFNPSAPSLNIGKVIISADSGVSANVGVIRDSLKFVRGSELVSPDGEIEYPDEVRITAGSGGSGQLPDPPPADTSEDIPTETPTETPAETPADTPTDIPIDIPTDTSETGNSGVILRPGTQAPDTTTSTAGNSPASPSETSTAQNGNEPPAASDTRSETAEPVPQETAAGENFNPADTSRLSEVLTIAGSYKQGAYTDSSFKTLTEAMEKARVLLDNPNSTQEDIDEALLILENAIGMLTLKNDIPSGAEGYGAGNEVSISIGNDNNGDDIPQVSINANGETVTSPQEEQTSDSSAPQNSQAAQEGSGQEQPSESSEEGNPLDSQSPDNGESPEGEGTDNSLTVWIIVLVVVAAALAAVAIITVMNANKKKAQKGKHTK